MEHYWNNIWNTLSFYYYYSYVLETASDPTVPTHTPTQVCPCLLSVCMIPASYMSIFGGIVGTLEQQHLNHLPQTLFRLSELFRERSILFQT
jgi:hypothetical protein